MAEHKKMNLTPADVNVADGNIVIALEDDRLAVMPLEAILQCAEAADLIQHLPDPDAQ